MEPFEDSGMWGTAGLFSKSGYGIRARHTLEALSITESLSLQSRAMDGCGVCVCVGGGETETDIQRGRGMERKRETVRERERERDRQTDRQTYRQIDRQTDRQTEREREGEREKEEEEEGIANTRVVTPAVAIGSFEKSTKFETHH